MDFSDSSWKYCLDTGRSTGAYIIFYQGVPIDHSTHVPGPVSQSSAENEYNAACTAGMALAHFRMLIHEFLNKDLDIVREEAPLIVLDGKSDMCMAKNGKDTKHIIHIARRMHFVSKLVLKLIITWWICMIIVDKIVQTLTEVQDQTLYFIKVRQLTMAQMFQYQLLNPVHKVSTMQHVLQEWL